MMDDDNVQIAREITCETLKRINNLASLPQNWDAYGAPPIDERIIATAKYIALRVPLLSVPMVVPMSGGNLQFEWHIRERFLELEFELPNAIHYLIGKKTSPDRSKMHEDFFDANEGVRKAKVLIEWVHTREVPLTYEYLAELAKKYPPPDEWWDEEDET